MTKTLPELLLSSLTDAQLVNFYRGILRARMRRVLFALNDQEAFVLRATARDLAKRLLKERGVDPKAPMKARDDPMGQYLIPPGGGRTGVA